jgi:hypothetical protein
MFLENEKYQNYSQQSESKLERVMAQLAGISITVILILAIIGVSVLFLIPCCTRLSVTVTVSQLQQTYQPTMPTMVLNYGSYSKVPLGTVLGSTRDVPVLTLQSSISGPYSFSAGVVVNRQVVGTNQTFQNIGLGTYQLTVTYFVQQAPSGVPFLFQVILLQGTVSVAQVTAYLYPS